jgi:sugar phosphate isomerase/epimerase
MLSRRDFIATAAAASISTPLWMPAQSAAAPTDANTLCVFSKHLLFLRDYDEMAEAAAGAGFDGLDLAVRPGGHVLPEQAERDLPRAVAAAKKAGLQTCMITTAITDARASETTTTLRVAADLGIKYYRMGYLNFDERVGIAQSLEALRPGLAALAALNERHRIHGAYQNHAGRRVGGPVWDLWVLLKDLDPQWIGCQYDIRHATVEGGTSWPLGLKLLAPWIKLTAIKDFLWAKESGKWAIRNVPLGDGMTDFPTYLPLAWKLGIRGPVSMHFEYPMTSRPEASMPKAEARKQVVAAMQKDVSTLRAWLKQYHLAG